MMFENIFAVMYGIITGGLVVMIWYEASAYVKERGKKIDFNESLNLDKVKEHGGEYEAELLGLKQCGHGIWELKTEERPPKRPRAKRPYKCQTCNGSEYYTYGKTRKIRVCRSCWDSSKDRRNAYAKKYYKKHKPQVAARMRAWYQKNKGQRDETKAKN